MKGHWGWALLVMEGEAQGVTGDWGGWEGGDSQHQPCHCPGSGTSLLQVPTLSMAVLPSYTARPGEALVPPGPALDHVFWRWRRRETLS